MDHGAALAADGNARNSSTFGAELTRYGAWLVDSCCRSARYCSI